MNTRFKIFEWYYPLLAIICITSLGTTNAQENTPVRQLGQGGTSANPFEIGSDGEIQRRKRELPQGSISSDSQSSSLSDSDAWWQGMSELAESSINKSNWSFKYGLTASYEFDDNFAMRSTDEQETSIYAVSPFGVLSYGESGSGIDFQLRYAPEFRWFSDSSISNIVNHNISTQLGFNGSKSRVALTGGYTINEGGNVEVGSLVTSNIFDIGLQANYDITPKTSLGMNLKYTDSEFDTFNSFSKSLAVFYADYKVTDKTRLGLSVGYDHIEQDLNPSSDAYNLSLRAAWTITSRMSLNATVGGEYREFEGGEEFAEPVGDIGVSYSLTDKSSLRVSAYRRATHSIGLANSMFYATGIALTANVKATDKLSLSLTTGFENAVYENTAGAGGIDREDDFLFIRPSVSYIISKNWNVNLFYQYSQNESNQINSGFDHNQVGISVTVTY